MKSYKIVILIFACALLGFSSCSDYLDQMPDEQLSEANLFRSKDDVVKVLTQIYGGSGYMQVNVFQDYIGLAGDDTEYNWNNYGPYYKDEGQYSSSSGIFNNWTSYYNRIRTSIYFLNRIDECKDEKLTPQDREYWKGEAYFLQAYYTFRLLSEYGPVPILDKIYNGNDMTAAMNAGIPRAHFDTIVKRIDTMLMRAINRLDASYLESVPDRAGRANASAAWFLRSRLYLYAASPLYNGQESPITGKKYPHLVMKDNEGKDLLNTQYDKERWKKARDITAQAIDFCENRGEYALLKESTVASKTGYYFYKRLFNYPRSGAPSSETVFFNQSFNLGGILDHCLPLTWGKYSGSCVTLEHVKEYFMANGLIPEDDAYYEAATGFDTYKSPGNTVDVNLYKKFRKREPRFYANILFPEQCSYRMLDSTTETFTGKWAYASTNGTEKEVYFHPYASSPDGLTGKGSGRNWCNTGFLQLKYVSPTSTATGIEWNYATTIYRFTELYLNYTEAAFEYDAASGISAVNDNEVFKYWDRVRDRAGIPSAKSAYTKAGKLGLLTNAKLRDLIHRERRIEFAFEGMRYYDNRRWLDAEREGGPKHGFDVTKEFNTGFWTETVFETRVWYSNDRMYFMPIPQSEINKNPKLTQNRGW